MPDESGPKKIAPLVGIMGSGRSGSTLLEYLLAGQVAGARALGELESLVVRGPRDNEPCSCGRPAARCPRWAPVTGWLTVHPLRPCWEDAIENRAYRRRWGVALYARAFARRVARRPECPGSGTAGYSLVIDALAHVSGDAKVLIDNSKTPLHFFALTAAGCRDLRIIHIVRRPQAVAWSWRRRKHLPESGSKNWFMEPKPVPLSTLGWLFDAFLAVSFQISHPAVRYARVFYDDLCRDTETTLARCIAALELGRAPVPGPPADYHVLGGNPARFDGFDRIELDDEWRARLGRPARILLALTAAPVYWLLLRASDGLPQGTRNAIIR